MEHATAADRNIILLGMPGAGKSTIGVLLAKRTARGFVDSDVLIEVREGMLLQEILELSDYRNLRRIEQEVLLSLDLRRHVIATGGSAAYSRKAMRHLKKNGVIVFLDVPFDILEARIHNFETRGIACPPNTSLREIHEERLPLYRQWADITLDCGSKGHDDIVTDIMESSERYPQPRYPGA